MFILCSLWALGQCLGEESEQFFFVPQKVFLLIFMLAGTKIVPGTLFLLHSNWLIILHINYLLSVWHRRPRLPCTLHWFCPKCSEKNGEKLKMTSVSQPMTHPGRVATLLRFASLPIVPPPPLSFCPSKNNSISLLGLATILFFSSLLFLVVLKWRKRHSL